MSFVAVAIGGMNAMNAINQGRYAKGQADLQGQQADSQAKQEQEQALKTAAIIRNAGRRQVGQANTAFAGAGVKVGEGSAGEVEREINQNVEHDAFQAILDGDRRALGLQAEGKMARARGKAEQAAGFVNAAGSLLSSGYQAMRSNGWRTAGPGFSGTQPPAPVETRTINFNSKG